MAFEHAVKSDDFTVGCRIGCNTALFVFPKGSSRLAQMCRVSHSPKPGRRKMPNSFHRNNAKSCLLLAEDITVASVEDGEGADAEELADGGTEFNLSSVSHTAAFRKVANWNSRWCRRSGAPGLWKAC
jgi:hypothetical protein